jgi:UDP-2-acetamido-3-amino-2,3-dideoxy-glucuronate N-acetyltransferase
LDIDLGWKDLYMSYFKHDSAFVDEQSTIGDGTKIWHFCHIQKGARIGKNCIFGQNCHVANDVVIGSQVKVQNNVSVFTGTIIEDDVFLGPSCVLTNVSNPRSQVNRHSLFETTILKRGCTVGANATVVCGIVLGRYSFVGAGAVVVKDVPDYGLVLGNPGRLVGFMSRHGHRLVFDSQGLAMCPESGLRYNIKGGVVKCIDVVEDDPLPEGSRVGFAPYRSFKKTPS